MPFFTLVGAQCDVCGQTATDRVEDGTLIYEMAWRQVTDVPWLGHDWFLCSVACVGRWVWAYGRPGSIVTMQLRDGMHTFPAGPARGRRKSFWKA